MILTELDNELGGLILKHKEINKSALALKYGVDRHTIDRHIKAIEAPTERKLRECGLLKYYEIIENQLKVDPSIKGTYMYLLNISSHDEIGSYSNFKQYVEKHFSNVRKESNAFFQEEYVYSSLLSKLSNILLKMILNYHYLILLLLETLYFFYLL